jgi:hypothetical protein
MNALFGCVAQGCIYDPPYAGAETASRVRIAFAAAYPEAALFASLARCFQPAGP